MRVADKLRLIAVGRASVRWHPVTRSPTVGMNKGWLVSVATKGEMQRSTTMRIKLTYIAPLLAAGAAAVAIAAAPTAAAAIGQTCSGNVCQSPGNVQINNAPPPVQ